MHNVLSLTLSEGENVELESREDFSGGGGAWFGVHNVRHRHCRRGRALNCRVGELWAEFGPVSFFAFDHFRPGGTAAMCAGLCRFRGE